MTHPPGNFGATKLPRDSEGAALKEVPEFKFKFARKDGVYYREREFRMDRTTRGKGSPRPSYGRIARDYMSHSTLSYGRSGASDVTYNICNPYSWGSG